jgi:phage gp36-like protein
MERKDWRQLGDLVADDGEQVTEGDLLVDPRLQAALDDASGEIDAALLVGGRYSVADLAGLTGDAAKYLARITCEIAVFNLQLRRFDLDAKKLEVIEKLRERLLEPLRTGKNIFGLDEKIAAGKASVDGPTIIEYDTVLNLFRDRTRNYFPRRHTVRNR